MAIAEEFELEIQSSVVDQIELDQILHTYHFETDQDTMNAIHIMLMMTDIEAANDTEIMITEGWN